MTQERRRTVKRSHEINMTTGRMMPKLWKFIVPLMCSSMLQITFNAADLIVVGRYGRPMALAAVGSNNSLINLVINLLVGLSVGASVLCARYFGAKEQSRLRKTVGTTLLLGICGGVVVGAFGILMAMPLLRLIGSPDEVAPLAAVYLRIYFAGMPVIALYNYASAALRALGNTSQPLLYLALAGLLNVLMNLFFVLVVGIDVAGVALATVLSQCVSCFLTVRCLLKTQGLTVRKLRFDRVIFWRIVQIGLPAGLQGTLFSVSNFIIQSSVNSFGAAVIAGNAAAVSVENFVYCIHDASQQAATTAVSQNVGAHEPRRARIAAGQSISIMAMITVVVLTLLIWQREAVIRLFTADRASLDAGVTRMLFVLGFYLLDGAMVTMSGVNRGLGYSMASALISFFGACVFRIVWVYAVFPAYHTLGWLYISYPISWVITTAAHVGCYLMVRKRPFREIQAKEKEETAKALG